jgi:hypothetical protein
MALLATLVIVYSNRGFETDLNTAAAEVAQVLRDAREKTLASVDDTVWGVDFDVSTYILYSGSYGSHTTQQTYSLPQNLQFSTATQADYVEFVRLTGEADDDHTITIEQTGNASQTLDLYVSAGGAIGSGSVAQLPTAVVDSRFVKITNGLTINDGDDLDIIFTDIGGSPIQGSTSLVGASVGDYVIYSDEFSVNGYTLPVKVVAETENSHVIYVYWDGEAYVDAGIGLVITHSGIEIINIDVTGEIESPLDPNDYELY